MRLPKRFSIPEAIGKGLFLIGGVLLLKPCRRKASEIVIGTESLDNLRH
jgi:hypothetical protein